LALREFRAGTVIDFREGEFRMAAGEITLLLHRATGGDGAARDQLFTMLYGDLKRLAHVRLRQNEQVTLLDTVSLVHDTYLRLFNSKELGFEDRGRFFGYASTVMRNVIVDAVRSRHAQRRGGEAEHVPIDTWVSESVGDPGGTDEEVLRVNEALEMLQRMDPRLAQVVEMRYFGGLTETDIAQALGITDRTVRRDWEKARAILFTSLQKQ
jgi:RNA polymerase sigma factor (TIGR02999 family)